MRLSGRAFVHGVAALTTASRARRPRHKAYATEPLPRSVCSVGCRPQPTRQVAAFLLIASCFAVSLSKSPSARCGSPFPVVMRSFRLPAM